MTNRKTKEPVRIRQKALANGNISLYLDIYINGKREYEFLKMYLIPEKSKEDRDHNRETLSLAEAVKSMRIVDIQAGRYGFNSKSSEDTNFYEYYSAMCEARLGSKNNWGNWKSCLKHLEKYDKHLKKRSFADITPAWVKGFRDYLENSAKAWENDKRDRIKTNDLSRNSCVSYFRKLVCCLNTAYDDKIIADNPARGIDGFKQEEGTRMYLTVDEVRRLAQTDCDYISVKKAFLFSCLTGLRRSDIMKLTWGEVHNQGEFTRLIFRQKKTGGQEYLDITPEAAELMGERGKPSDNVFDDFYTPSCTNECIKRWCLRAGIDKEITFHCGRHTFATMMIDIGTDIYTVSKLLGHRELNTTQIYAKVLDRTKQEAVKKIPSVLEKK